MQRPCWHTSFALVRHRDRNESNHSIQTANLANQRTGERSANTIADQYVQSMEASVESGILKITGDHHLVLRSPVDNWRGARCATIERGATHWPAYDLWICGQNKARIWSASEKALSAIRGEHTNSSARRAYVSRLPCNLSLVWGIC